MKKKPPEMEAGMTKNLLKLLSLLTAGGRPFHKIAP
jgi:hypothetical protein